MVVDAEIGEANVELTVFDWSKLSAATNRFSSSNIVGKGGFGPVYKVTVFLVCNISALSGARYGVH